MTLTITVRQALLETTELGLGTTAMASEEQERDWVQIQA